jgi:hypothetical protein
LAATVGGYRADLFPATFEGLDPPYTKMFSVIESFVTRVAANVRSPLSADSVEKVASSRLPGYWALKTLLYAPLHEIRARIPLFHTKILMSSACFFTVETMAGFFNRIGQKRTDLPQVKIPI